MSSNPSEDPDLSESSPEDDLSSVPAEVLAPMIQFMSDHKLGKMELTIEAVDSQQKAGLEPAATKTQTAVLDPDLTCHAAPDHGTLASGAFITISVDD